ncbi:uncharacterized protein [Brachyistius frenatus]|uniref:uncharacterized protein n=1 Tax=Brachyistius frenatus TaxID=100188 RepID=UPI0037E7D21E
MTPPKFALYLTCLFLDSIAQGTNHHQGRRFVSASVGESLTLGCFYQQQDTTGFYWYKQSLGQQPRLISSLYLYNKNGTFSGEFKNNPRFTMDAEISNNHLQITDLRISDSATYYCAKRVSFTVIFAEGTVVSVKGSGLNIKASVQQSESIQPGGSVTLNCTVHTGTCDGEHRVYWFKDSEESHPGLIYTDGGSNDQCEGKPDTQTHTCMYNLPMKSLNPSHAGTYYCAVASCGRILFGNGTKLNSEDEVKSPVLVYFLSGALTFTTTLAVFLAFLLYNMSKRNGFRSESQARSSAPSIEGNQNADDLHYAALSVDLPNRSRRQRSTNSECVYSSVKQQY